MPTWRPPEKLNDAMARSMAEAEVRRLDNLRLHARKEYWAWYLGNAISTHLLSVGAEGTLGTNDGIAQVIIWELTEQLVELYLHPTLGTGFTAGVIEDLASRKLINISVPELQSRRATLR